MPAGLLLTFRAGIRSRHKPAELKADLEEGLKMPSALADLLVRRFSARC